jgi:DNA mismatch endonuclease, patch repair protein
VTQMGLTRSQNMARIRGRDTSPELIIRRGLWDAGLRYRLHVKTAGGRPDVVVTRVRLAIFVDGCFWHGCPEHYVRPRSRNDFWDAKLRENVHRDRRQTLKLEEQGWRVLRIWEHEVREQPERTLKRILECALRPRLRKAPAWRVVKVEALDAIGSLERRYLEDLRFAGRLREQICVRVTRKLGRVRRVASRHLL